MCMYICMHAAIIKSIIIVLYTERGHMQLLYSRNYFHLDGWWRGRLDFQQHPDVIREFSRHVYHLVAIAPNADIVLSNSKDLICFQFLLDYICSEIERKLDLFIFFNLIPFSEEIFAFCKYS